MFHGMTKSEVEKVAKIRAMSHVDMAAAKREASKFIMANKRRTSIRRMGINVIRGINRA